MGGGGGRGKAGAQQTDFGGGEQGSQREQRRGLQGGKTGTIGGTMSGKTGAGHCLNVGLHLQGGHGVQGQGGGQHGRQHGGGGGHEVQHGPVPHGIIEGHVGQKLQQQLRIVYENLPISTFF